MRTIAQTQSSRRVAFVAVLVLVCLARGGAAWSYTGSTGPASWALVYPACAQGLQSPIALSTAAARDNTPKRWRITKATASNVAIASLSAGMISMSIPKGNVAIDLDGFVGYLSRVNLRAPGEHSIDGVKGDAELQYLFLPSSNRSGHSAVIISELIMAVDAAGEPAAFVPPNVDAMVTAITGIINGNALIEEALRIDPAPRFTSSAFVYRGSRTFPPCAQGVLHVVSAEKLHLPRSRLAAVVALTPAGSARPLQPAAGRTVRRTTFYTGNYLQESLGADNGGDQSLGYILHPGDRSDIVNAKADALRTAAVVLAIITAFFFLVNLYLIVQRATYTSNKRDRWMHPETGLAEFGGVAAPLKHAPEATESSGAAGAEEEEGEEDEEEEGEEEEA